MSLNFHGDPSHAAGSDAADGHRERPGPAVPVPTLTEVLEPGDPVAPEPGPTALSTPESTPESVPAGEASPPLVPVQAGTPFDAALARARPEIGHLFEWQLREALEPALFEAVSASLAPLVASLVQAAVDAAVDAAVELAMQRTRTELRRALHERVAAVMAQEMHGPL